jgi:hypothetical protein
MLRGGYASLQWLRAMKTLRRGHVLLVLLGLMIDLVNPTMPGIFSLLHGDLYMDGVTRAYESVADATCMRDCPRVRIAVDASSAVVARAAPVVVRDARRAQVHPDPRRPVHVTAAHGSADTDDH